MQWYGQQAVSRSRPLWGARWLGSLVAEGERKRVHGDMDRRGQVDRSKHYLVFKSNERVIKGPKKDMYEKACGLWRVDELYEVAVRGEEANNFWVAVSTKTRWSSATSRRITIRSDEKSGNIMKNWETT